MSLAPKCYTISSVLFLAALCAIGVCSAGSACHDCDAIVLLQNGFPVVNKKHNDIEEAFTGNATEWVEEVFTGDATEWVDRIMGQMEKFWTTGFWAEDTWGPQLRMARMRNPSNEDLKQCGSSTFKELQMTIPVWKKSHPEVIDPFCYFQNHAMWFAGQYRQEDYMDVGKGPQHLGDAPGKGYLCDSAGHVEGPEVTLIYDAGTITWNHLRNCIDFVDDPYCYSLGWLKGQGIDGSLMSNTTAWEEKAKQECARIQEEFHFDDEEITVGRHIMTTPLYFKQSWNSFQGNGSPITKRLHNEHVYTKCQLGDGAPMEMTYCYYKACVLAGNRIGHTSECNYDSNGVP